MSRQEGCYTVVLPGPLQHDTVPSLTLFVLLFAVHYKYRSSNSISLQGVAVTCVNELGYVRWLNQEILTVSHYN